MCAPPPPISRVKDYRATALVWILALIVTIAWWAHADLSDLMADAHIAHGQIWRLLTTTLLHADPIHLVFNLFWLWTFGTLIEEHLGPRKTLAIFAYLAIGSGAAEFTFLRGGIGLSGIGYGLLGLIWTLDKRGDERFAGAIDEKTITVFGAWFAFCVITTVTGTYPVANIAHCAGALLGALLGWSMTQPIPGTQKGGTQKGDIPIFPSSTSAERSPKAENRNVPFSFVKAENRNVPFLFVARCAPAIATFLLLTTATILRPYLNLSSARGAEEGQIGYQLLAAGDARAAAGYLRDAASMQPTTAVYWFDLAIAEAQLKRYESALAAYRRASDLDPQNQKYKSALNEMDSYVARTRS